MPATRPRAKTESNISLQPTTAISLSFITQELPPASARSGISTSIRFKNAFYVEASILATPSTSVPSAVTSPSSPTDAILASAPPVP